MRVDRKEFSTRKEMQEYIKELRANPGKFHPVRKASQTINETDGYLIKYAEWHKSCRSDEKPFVVDVCISTAHETISGFDCDCRDSCIYRKDVESEILLGWLGVEEVKDLLS